MADDVNPHRFGQEEKDDEPAGGAGEQGRPEALRGAGVEEHPPQGLEGGQAHRQEENPDAHFEPFRHGGRIGLPAPRGEEFFQGVLSKLSRNSPRSMPPLAEAEVLARRAAPSPNGARSAPVLTWRKIWFLRPKSMTSLRPEARLER